MTRWSLEKTNTWYVSQPWLVGCNFIPSTAVNQLEMWQADTYDPTTIKKELGWAANRLGFNTVRTYLHDRAWQADPDGFKVRLDHFLGLAAALGIRPILVFFDDCWNPDAHAGPQPAPRPSVHNSGWLQSPGVRLVNEGPAAWSRLQAYVTDIVQSFAQDERILLWDLYNEPGNSDQGDRSLPLLQALFDWVRAAGPGQPLSAGIWYDNEALNQFQLAASDVITFHNYLPAVKLEQQIAALRAHGRPLICTEWLARSQGSLVETNLPVFAREQVGCLNWGLVAGKTNTIWPWGTDEGAPDPIPWFHDLYQADGTPYAEAEVALFRRLTSRP